MKKAISSIIAIFLLLYCGVSYASGTVYFNYIEAKFTYILGETIEQTRGFSGNANREGSLSKPSLYNKPSPVVGDFEWVYNEQSNSYWTPFPVGAKPIIYRRNGTITITGKAAEVGETSIKFSASGSFHVLWGDCEVRSPVFTIKVIDNNYSVKLNANGGFCESTSHSVIYNSPYSQQGNLPVPSRDGHNFLGWYTAQTGGALVTDETLFLERNAMINESTVTLYAHWAPITYEVNYYGNANEVTNVPSAQTKIWGEDLPIAATVPELEGYVFRGWGTNPYDSAVSFKPGDYYQENSPINLYAKWLLRTYIVAFDGNGENVTMIPLEEYKIHGMDINIPDIVPVRENAIFLGWSTAAGSETAEYQPGDVFSLNEDTTLYAVWDTNYFTVTYDANGGEKVPAQQTKTQGAVLTLSADVPVRSDSSAGSYTVTLDANGGSVSPNNLSAARTTSYTFRNWNTAPNGEGTSYAPGASYTADADVTLYAQWTGSTDTEAVTLPVPVREGYEFKGWAESSSSFAGITGSYTPGGNETLYAVWEALPLAEYAVIYDANGGVNAPAQQIKTENAALTLSSAVPTRSASNAGSYTVTLDANGGSVSPNSLTAARTTSYTFRNWNTAPNGEGTSYAPGASYTADADVTLYAQWTGSTETAAVTLPVPVREGYEFKGWAQSSSSFAGITGSYTPDGNITLYAVWEALPPAEYAVVYNANGGVNAPAQQIKTENTALTLSSAVPTRSASNAGSYTVTLDANGGSVSPNSLSAARTTSYTFRNWNTAQNGTGISYAPGASYTENADATLYAQWDSSTDTEAVTLPVPVREGYEFKGWAQSSSASAGVTGSYMPDGNITLYAVWESENMPNAWGDLFWTLNDDGVLTISGSGTMNDFDAESALAWRGQADRIQKIIIKDGVSSISSSAFRGCSALTSVDIPASVTVIGRSAFYDCTNLADVAIAYGVERIGDWVFRGCEKLETISIPASVTSIGEQAFCLCTSLDSVTIPYGISSIGAYAFNYCSSLTEAVIPDSVTNLGEGMFYACSSLVSVKLPQSISAIGECFFYDCAALKSISLPKGLTSIGSWAFRGCTSLTQLWIPDTVTSIGDRAFCLCSSLRYITLPNGITTVEDLAFYGCSSLKYVGIPRSVTRIGSSAFSGCDKLQSATIPHGVISIGDYAFSGCVSLDYLTLPGSIADIDHCAFNGCTSLKNVYYDGTKADWNAISIGLNNSCLTSAAIRYPAILVLPASLTEIETQAFVDGAFDWVIIPETITSIGSRAFAKCLNLKRIVFVNGNADVAEDFVSGCWDTLIIEAPQGSSVANHLQQYRQYLCPMPPYIDVEEDFVSDYWISR